LEDWDPDRAPEKLLKGLLALMMLGLIIYLLAHW